MSDFDARTSRSNHINFANGTVSVTVDYWGNGFGTTELDLDHLMGSAVTSVYEDITALNKAIAKSTGGITKHASTRSMTVNETSVRVKVAVSLTSPLSSISLAGYVESILSKVAVCMLHTVDSSAMEELGGSRLMDLLKSSVGRMFGDVPPEAMADPFGPGYGGHPSHAHPNTMANTGQYL